MDLAQIISTATRFFPGQARFVGVASRFCQHVNRVRGTFTLCGASRYCAGTVTKFGTHQTHSYHRNDIVGVVVGALAVFGMVVLVVSMREAGDHVVAVMVVAVMLDDIAVVVLVFVVDVIVDTVMNIMNVVKFLVDVGGMAVRVVESRSDTRPV